MLSSVTTGLRRRRRAIAASGTAPGVRLRETNLLVTDARGGEGGRELGHRRSDVGSAVRTMNNKASCSHGFGNGCVVEPRLEMWVATRRAAWAAVGCHPASVTVAPGTGKNCSAPVRPNASAARVAGSICFMPVCALIHVPSNNRRADRLPPREASLWPLMSGRGRGQIVNESSASMHQGRWSVPQAMPGLARAIQSLAVNRLRPRHQRQPARSRAAPQRTGAGALLPEPIASQYEGRALPEATVRWANVLPHLPRGVLHHRPDAQRRPRYVHELSCQAALRRGQRRSCPWECR